MGADSLEGTDVYATFSYPWDYVTEAGGRPLAGHILRLGRDYWRKGVSAALLRLASPLSVRGVTYNHLIASPRYEGVRVGDLSAALAVECNFTGIPDERLDAGDPFDLSWWEGGGAFTGMLRVAGTANGRH